ncbi:MAG: Ig-like domain-containing protein, partial [Clostridia bacterium]|nr:Ig-like domain-containing protein [Clostridia bacterium]
MNTKRFISIALTVLMLLTTSTVAFAAGTFTIVAPKVTEELEAGKTIEYKIEATENPGYAVGQITMNWDNTALEFTKIVFNDDIAPNAYTQKANNSGSFVISFGDDIAESNFTKTGVLFTLTFKILDTATAKEYPIELIPDDANFLDYDINKVDASCQNGSITLTAKPVPATSVAVDKATVSIDEGQTETVTATVKPDDTTDTLEWKSADTSIATVADGVITGVKEGTTTVTATAGSKSATVSVTVTKPACVHNWVAGTTVEPTCTEEGYTEYTCDICSETKKDDVKSALGHDYKDTVVEPTCTEQGYTTHVCSRCGDKIVDSYKEALGHKSDTYTPKDDNNHTLTCSVCGLETVEAHTWKTEVTKEATH